MVVVPAAAAPAARQIITLFGVCLEKHKPLRIFDKYVFLTKGDISARKSCIQMQDAALQLPILFAALLSQLQVISYDDLKYRSDVLAASTSLMSILNSRPIISLLLTRKP